MIQTWQEELKKNSLT